MYYRKSSLERALSMPDSSTPRSIKSITWMSIIDPSSYPQTQPHIQVLLKFEWILFKILRILTTWTAASQASQARSLSSGETLDTWIFFSGKDIQLWVLMAAVAGCKQFRFTQEVKLNQNCCSITQITKIWQRNQMVTCPCSQSSWRNDNCSGT